MPEKIKKEPLLIVYAIIFAILFSIITSMFSFYILQSDDYYYSSFFKDGFIGFIKLTAHHFTSVNGRAFVHLFAQCAMALPKFLTSLLSSVILFLISFFFSRLTKTAGDTKSKLLFHIIFYCFIMLLGGKVMREAVMWMSGFYNYVFPLLSVALMLYFKTKNSPMVYPLAFLSGFTTEQWGFGAACIIAVYLICTIPKPKTLKALFVHFLPLVLTVLGYLSIFLSPATVSRITSSAHMGINTLPSDFSRMAEIFFDKGSAVFVILIFILITTVCAYTLKKSFRALYLGIPVFFVILFSKNYRLSLALLIAYIILCTVVFLLENMVLPASLLTGALATVLIMLFANTFEYRISFAPVMLMALTSLILIFEWCLPEKVFLVSFVSLVLIAGLVFAPSYMGFYRNFLIERNNLEAVREAKITKVLNYCIDYDKNYAMRQMFNDGWFFKQFLSLYDIEDCTVYLDSKYAKSVSLNGETFNFKALLYNGEYYVPMRQLLEEAGGTVCLDDNIVMQLGDYTLSYIDWALVYTDFDGVCQYLVADENKLLDYYTLYIKLSVVNKAFHTDFITK